MQSDIFNKEKRDYDTALNDPERRTRTRWVRPKADPDTNWTGYNTRAVRMYCWMTLMPRTLLKTLAPRTRWNGTRGQQLMSRRRSWTESQHTQLATDHRSTVRVWPKLHTAFQIKCFVYSSIHLCGCVSYNFCVMTIAHRDWCGELNGSVAIIFRSVEWA